MNLLYESVLVLNKYFMAVTVTTVRDAIVALYTGKARVIDTSYKCYNFEEWALQSSFLEKEKTKDYSGLLNSPTKRVFAPQVIQIQTDHVTNATFKSVKFSRKNVFQRDNYTCQYCKKKFLKAELTQDHIIPKSLGGKTEWTNITTSCKKCNTKKGSKTLQQLNWKIFHKPYVPRWKSYIGKTFNQVKKRYWGTFLGEK